MLDWRWPQIPKTGLFGSYQHYLDSVLANHKLNNTLSLIYDICQIKLHLLVSLRLNPSSILSLSWRLRKPFILCFFLVSDHKYTPSSQPRRLKFGMQASLNPTRRITKYIDRVKTNKSSSNRPIYIWKLVCNLSFTQLEEMLG